MRKFRAAIAVLLGIGVVGWIVVASINAWADETRPAVDAELLIARYPAYTVIFGYPGQRQFKALPDIAVYSDGTVLTQQANDKLGYLNITTIPSEIARERSDQFVANLASAAPSYQKSCWIRQSDGRKTCMSDGGTVNLILKRPNRTGYKAVAVYAGDSWREFPEMRDYLPVGYFDLVSWLDGLQRLPSRPWQMPAAGVPGLTASAPACAVAKALCP